MENDGRYLTDNITLDEIETLCLVLRVMFALTEVFWVW